MRRVLPLDASCEDIDVSVHPSLIDIQIDINLPFLNGLVQEARGRGAKPYRPLAERESAKRAARGTLRQRCASHAVKLRRSVSVNKRRRSSSLHTSVLRSLLAL